MARLRDRLPPANSLVVFEAVARHLSFTQAARELRVTQAAVSRQVQILEERFGLPLFERLHRSIRLTPAGAEFAKAVSIGLEHIANAADGLSRDHSDGADITIASSVTFASYWLMSRIAKFRAQHPQVDLRLVASARPRERAAAGVDLAVRYGRGGWPNVEADLMFENEIYCVCAPSYLQREGPIAELADLTRATLLHLAQFDRNWVTWDSWFERFGLTPEPDASGLYFDNYMLLLHAAVRGEGVALCGRRLAEDLIERGELIRPVAVALQSEYAFYLLRPAHQPLRPEAAEFREWLLAEARGAAAA